MILNETSLRGAWLIDPEPLPDERGFFARSFCRDEFERVGLDARIAQTSLSYNYRAGTLRGLHFQAPPHAETRRVFCSRGHIFDVIVDLREGSPTRHRWLGVELSAANRRQIVVPEGFAHGFQTLEDETEVHYAMSVPYVAGASRGWHHASPAFAIEWPLPVACISARDRALARLGEGPGSAADG